MELLAGGLVNLLIRVLRVFRPQVIDVLRHLFERCFSLATFPVTTSRGTFFRLAPY